MNGAFGGAGRAARKVEQRRVFRVCGLNSKGRTGLLHEGSQVLCARNGGGLPVVSDDQDVFKAGDRRADSGHFSLIERVGSYEDFRLADTESCSDRLGTEGRKQGAEHAAVLEGPERGDVELRNASRQNKHAIASADAQLLQHVGEAIRQLGQPAVGVILDGAVLPQPSDRQMRRERSVGMAIDGLMRNVEALIAREPFQVLSGLFPCEVRTDALVIVKIWNGLPLSAGFDDRSPRHGGAPLSMGSARHRPLMLRQKTRNLLANP